VSFAAPLFLVALLTVPLALLLYLRARRRGRRYAVRHPGVPVLAGLGPMESRWLAHLPTTLFLLAAAVLVLALARPEATVAVAVEQASVVLVMDGSRSMLADDVKPSRIEAARGAAHSFLDRVPEDLRVGLVGFSTSPHTRDDPTDDHERISAAIDDLSADGATATGEALVAALSMLRAERDEEGRRAPGAVVLLSDGKTTIGREPVGVAREAGRLKVPIYTVSLGTDTAAVPGPSGGSLPVPPDPETMRQIARASDARAFKVDDADELDTVYEDLGSRIGSKREKRELTAGFAAGGIVLLLAAAALGVRRAGMLP
jgi:Ca-activated chloride channel homolog